MVTLRKSIGAVVIVLLCLYCATYAYLRYSFERGASFTYVFSSGYPRLITQIEPVYTPLQRAESLLTGRSSDLYRSRDE
jgi:hypothetical protein